jgi:hypothetical protein
MDESQLSQTVLRTYRMRECKQRLQRPVKCSKYLPYQDGDPWPPRWYGKLQRK